MKNHTIITEKMVFGGDCIGKIDGKTIFIPYAIPNEKLEVEITKDAGDYYQGKISKIIEASPHRVKPFCPYYEKCGGCNMQHISFEHQQELRKNILKDAFERDGINVPEIEIISGENKNYRSRFQFHTGGLMEKHSNNIIPIENCPCATNEINNYIEEV